MIRRPRIYTSYTTRRR